jgi:transmembrane sensor
MNNSHEKKARRIATLLAGYMRDNLTPAEHDELDEWVGASDKNMRLFEELTDERKVQLALDLLNDNNQSGLVKKLKEDQEYTYPNHRRFRRLKTLGIAASIVIAGSFIAWAASTNLFSPKNKSGNIASVDKVKSLEIVPASERANLILDDDEIITLDYRDIGIIARQGNSKVIKNKKGEISYEVNAVNQITDLRNKLITPKGGFYKVTLPDGTIAKLNASSSISYPVFFLGKERRVSITGEVYFEVASATEKGPNYEKPFFVDVNDRNMIVEVLGTHFNVNAYAEETIAKTTLLKGKVKIAYGENVKYLKPGQQAVVTSDGNLTVDSVETNFEISWMSHVIKANQQDLKSTLNALCRWYDLDLEYAPDANNTSLKSSYSGFLSLDKPLEESLNTLNKTTPHAHFEVRGRKLLVAVTPS